MASGSEHGDVFLVGGALIATHDDGTLSEQKGSDRAAAWCRANGRVFGSTAELKAFLSRRGRRTNTLDEHRPFELVSLDHVQLAMPPGGEAEAERFYAGLLGLERVPKPAALAVRGGCWFKRGSVQLHLGAEQDFRP